MTQILFSVLALLLAATFTTADGIRMTVWQYAAMPAAISPISTWAFFTGCDEGFGRTRLRQNVFNAGVVKAWDQASTILQVVDPSLAKRWMENSQWTNRPRAGRQAVVAFCSIEKKSDDRRELGRPIKPSERLAIWDAVSELMLIGHADARTTDQISWRTPTAVWS